MEPKSVSQYTTGLKNRIESTDSEWVRGEISNFVRAASRHCYFILKDSSAQIRCVLFKQRAIKNTLDLADGLEVEVFAKPTVYSPRGDLQLLVENIRLYGEGALFKQFMDLKRKLQNEGIFDVSVKRKIPFFPRTVGLVTSEHGAAVQDVISVLKRRMPLIRVIIFPTPVQGLGAGKSITEALRRATSYSELDVIIICRGGGSLEDLWGFNYEGLARAVFSCPIPIISGVGHESDFTIVDLAADLRSATPTAAAVAVSPDLADLNEQLRLCSINLGRSFQRYLQDRIQGLDYLSHRLLTPELRIKKQQESLKILRNRFSLAIQKSIQASKNKISIKAVSFRFQKSFLKIEMGKINDLSRMLKTRVFASLDEKVRKVEVSQHRLSSFNLPATLARGFSILRGSDGKIIKMISQVSVGDEISMVITDGEARALVKDVKSPTEK